MARSRFIVGLIILVFFVISFLTNIIGPLVPDVIRSFNLSLTLAGLLPFSFFIAYGIMSIPSGILVERWGERWVMILAFVLSAIGAMLFALIPQFQMYICSLFLIGAGMAMLQVAINPLLRVAGGEEHFAFNSVLAQLFFGLASFLSPFVFSWLVTTDGDATSGIVGMISSLAPDEMRWLSLYWVFTIVSLLMVFVIVASKFPIVVRKADEKVGALSVHLSLLRNPIVRWYFLGVFMYVGTEQGVANWISQFLQTYHGVDPQTTGAATVAMFWGLMTAGTALGLVLLKFVDSKKVITGFTVGAMVSLAGALFGTKEMAMIAFPVVGFFASVMWSIIISLALNSVSVHHGSLSGILVTGIAGGAIIPLIIGGIGDAIGLRGGMIFLFFTLAYILSIGFWAKPLINNKLVGQ
ncbi:MAG TPA: MFS transporter [Saprospiraceae bacterium]|nr:MFS transporter [Saprospiraceae bacterium]